MKLNWGTGIAIFYSLFVLAMISAVVKSCHNETHLVQENYYAKDLAYEGFRMARANARALSDPIMVDQMGREALQVQFPKNMQNVKGEVHLFRPANKYQDKIVPIVLDDGNQMRVPLDEGTRSSGKWVLKVTWENDAVPYYHEEIVVL
ncbi:MAG: FixH family protein [Saprospiraceae bacterium]|nr:FixH family protein [Saprospiraceae bacterium]